MTKSPWTPPMRLFALDTIALVLLGPGWRGSSP
jgi:hypothetical protein